MSNGVIAAPRLVAIVLMSGKPVVVGEFVLSIRLKAVGWLTTTVMAVSVLGMFLTWPRH